MIFHLTSKKPVLIVGNGIRSANAKEELDLFYRYTKIPILTTMNAVDLTSVNNRLGFIGVYGNRVANMIVRESDFVIAIGARLGLRQIGNRKELFAPKAKLIRADIDQYELSRNIKEDEEKYLIDAKDFLGQLLKEDITVYDTWNKKCFELKNFLNPYDKTVGNLCIEKIASLLPENPTITVDVGQNQCWTAQSLYLKGDKGRVIIGGSFGAMGCGLPYAIGAVYAMKKKPVYCITGDGGLQMNIQELQTISSQNLPVKIIVLNNKVLGKISEIQNGSYDSRYLITTPDSGYSVPDFEKISKAYGINAITIDSYLELNTYREWLLNDDPCLINIILPEDSILEPKMNWNQSEMLPMLDSDIMCKGWKLLEL